MRASDRAPRWRDAHDGAHRDDNGARHKFFRAVNRGFLATVRDPE
jgi:hypothetical protein